MKARNRGRRLNNSYLADYVVFDLETTGVNPDLDDIIEISAVRVCGHRVADTCSTLVNPHRPIPASATQINGITDDMVKDAPDLKEAMERFLDFIGENVLVGHNIHTFDMNFVHDAAQRTLGRVPLNDYVDTLYMARSALPELSHHRLTDIAEHFRIETKGAHRALQDCMMNQLCYEEMGKLLQNMPKESENRPLCPRCGALLIRRKGKYGWFYGCEGFPRCRYTRDA